jgi:hypothetical protein
MGPYCRGVLGRSPAFEPRTRHYLDRTAIPTWIGVYVDRAAQAAGYVLGRAGTSDVVDAVVAHAAARLHAHAMTGDYADIARLLSAVGADVRIIGI